MKRMDESNGGIDKEGENEENEEKENKGEGITEYYLLTL